MCIFSSKIKSKVPHKHRFKPYPFCVGHKYRKMPYMRRPLSIYFATALCNEHLSDTNKIRFYKQFYRWFLKATSAFLVEPILKNGEACRIVENDIIHVSCKMRKSAYRKLIAKLNLIWVDYKIVKLRRKYSISFTIFFANFFDLSVKPKTPEEVWQRKRIYLDINSTYNDGKKVFMVLSNAYVAEAMQFLFYFYITLKKKKVRDKYRYITV